jgi:hypothetical protein
MWGEASPAVSCNAPHSSVMRSVIGCAWFSDQFSRAGFSDGIYVCQRYECSGTVFGHLTAVGAARKADGEGVVVLADRGECAAPDGGLDVSRG